MDRKPALFMRVRRSPTHPSPINMGEGWVGDRDRRAEARGLALTSAAVPVPLLLRQGQAPKRRAPVPSSTVRVRGTSPPAEGLS